MVKIPMETLTELKRAIKPGVKIKLIDTNVKTLTKERGFVTHKGLNIVRTVTKAQSKSFAMATDEQLKEGNAGSWMDYPKANMIKFRCNDVFTFLFDHKQGRDYFVYQILS